MEIIRGITNIKDHHQQCVATIGNFDGVHLGHQALLAHLLEQGKKRQLPVLVIIFEPQPNEYFAQVKSVPRLMRLREKITALKKLGIDRLLCIPFNEDFAGMPAATFIQQVLVEKLAVNYLLVGDDFRFGYKRLGDIALLSAAGKAQGFTAESFATFEIDGSRVSSTRIRQLLAQGDLKSAQKLLGRPFSLQGRVAHGDKKGRTIGFPTANIHLHRKAVPVSGVFVIQMRGVGSQPLSGVANVGIRPTLSDMSRILLEVHLFNFNEDIYQQQVQIEFLKKVRDERKFETFEALKQQIALDVREAKQFFD